MKYKNIAITNAADAEQQQKNKFAQKKVEIQSFVSKRSIWMKWQW